MVPVADTDGSSPLTSNAEGGLPLHYMENIHQYITNMETSTILHSLATIIYISGLLVISFIAIQVWRSRSTREWLFWLIPSFFFILTLLVRNLYGETHTATVLMWTVTLSLSIVGLLLLLSWTRQLWPSWRTHGRLDGITVVSFIWLFSLILSSFASILLLFR